MAICKHPDFAARVVVNRLEDTGRFMADVTVNCSACGEPFRFVGVPFGVSMAQPMVSIDGFELRIPIAPGMAAPLGVNQ